MRAARAARAGLARAGRRAAHAAAGAEPRARSAGQLLHSYNEDINSGGIVPVFRRALLFPHRVAVQDELGLYTYAGLHQAASLLSEDICKQLGGESGATVAYLCGNDASHVIVQWAIWMSGNIAVPMTSLHPPAMLQYFVTDSSASLVVCTEEHVNLLRPIATELHRPLLVTSRGRQINAQLNQADNGFQEVKAQSSLADVGKSNSWYGGADAMLIYTSGTTNKPKGVVWTHSAWSTQVAALQQAWEYSSSDVVLHTLPLHHVHGQLNSLNASLAAGARVRILPSFVSHAVWARLLGMGERDDARVTVFHGVPTMYGKLCADHGSMFAAPRTADYVRITLKSRIRLMCSGSAPLPATLFQKWEEISGHRLLERYGMTEVGMALSNPYRPVEGRVEACVGLPLPGVGARLAAPEPDDPNKLQPLVTVETPEPSKQISLEKVGLESVKDLFADPTSGAGYDWKPSKIEQHIPPTDGVYQGELLLRGPGVFKRYWNRAPQIASKDFTPDGWFRTGDTASFANNRFKIMGRTSVDIIKTGGYKVSAVQIESLLLEHPHIEDVGVVGVPDPTWGEKICAAIVLKPPVKKISVKELREWGSEKMAPYQLPTSILVVEKMPRNHMGKLDKKELAKMFAGQTK